MMKDIDSKIREVCQAFTEELAKLHKRSDWPKYKTCAITLQVEFSPEKSGQFNLKYGGAYSSNVVKATNLGRLMDEVWRRNDFDDREEAAIQNLALPAPTEAE